MVSYKHVCERIRMMQSDTVSYKIYNISFKTPRSTVNWARKNGLLSRLTWPAMAAYMATFASSEAPGSASARWACKVPTNRRAAEECWGCHLVFFTQVGTTTPWNPVLTPFFLGKQKLYDWKFRNTSWKKSCKQAALNEGLGSFTENSRKNLYGDPLRVKLSTFLSPVRLHTCASSQVTLEWFSKNDLKIKKSSKSEALVSVILQPSVSKSTPPSHKEKWSHFSRDFLGSHHCPL